MSGLPQGWAEVSFGEINAFKTKTIDPTDFPEEEFELYSVPIFSTGNPEICKGKEIGSTKQLVAPGDVLVCKINPRINRVWMVTRPSELRQIASSEWIVMRAGGMYARYFRAFFSSPEFRKELCKDLTGVGGSLTRAQPKRVTTLQIPIAPLGEQKRISDKLGALLGRVEATRERLDRVPPMLKRFRQSVLAAATSGELTEDWRAGDGKTAAVQLNDETISVPGSWDITKLSEAIDPKRPLCYGVVQPGRESADGVRLIRVQDMENFSVLTKNLRTVSAEVDDEYRRSRVQTGDLLISIVGTIGRTAIVPAGLKANIARAVARISCAPGVDPRWVNIWLSSNPLQWWLLNSSKEVARKTLNLSDLSVTPIAIPPTDEQVEITRRVEALFALSDKAQALHEAARKGVERLTPALLSKAFRGELVPQNPDDEPVEKLLNRINAGKASCAISTKKKHATARTAR